MAFGNYVRLCWQVGVRSLFEWPRSWRKYCSVMCEVGTWARHMGLQACSLIIGWSICIPIHQAIFCISCSIKWFYGRQVKDFEILKLFFGTYLGVLTTLNPQMEQVNILKY